MRRVLLALAKDARTYIVGLAIAAVIADRQALLHHHVRVRAWVVVAVILALALVVIWLDRMRAHQRDGATRLSGALQRAERQLAEAKASPEPNAPARDLIRGIVALRTTITRRVEGYASTTGLNARHEEVSRYNVLVGRARTLIWPLPQDLVQALKDLNTGFGVEQPVDLLLSGLDLMEAEVTTWGLENQPDGPDPHG